MHASLAGPSAIADPPADLSHVDGRRLRSEDSRRRIVAAMLELVEAGVLAPSADQVAAKAGVGLRSVFRHFTDMDSLYLEIGEIIAPRLLAAGRLPFTGTTWQEQVAEFVHRRAVAFEALAQILRAVHLHSHRSVAVRAGRVQVSNALRTLLQSRVPDGALSATAFEALDMALSFEVWARLRDEQGLSVAAAKAVLSGLVDCILKTSNAA